MTPFYKKQQTNKQKRLKPPKTELFPESIAKLAIPLDVIYEYILSLLVYPVCFKFKLPFQEQCSALYSACNQLLFQISA